MKLLFISAILFLPAISIAQTNIAILVDGKSQYYDEIIELYEKEITELTAGEFDVNCSAHVPGNGGWTYQTIERKYRYFQANDNVGVVLTLAVVPVLYSIFFRVSFKTFEYKANV